MLTVGELLILLQRLPSDWEIYGNQLHNLVLQDDDCMRGWIDHATGVLDLAG